MEIKDSASEHWLTTTVLFMSRVLSDCLWHQLSWSVFFPNWLLHVLKIILEWMHGVLNSLG